MTTSYEPTGLFVSLQRHDGCGLPEWAYAVIVVGCVVVAALVIGIPLGLRRRRTQLQVSKQLDKLQKASKE